MTHEYLLFHLSSRKIKKNSFTPYLEIFLTSVSSYSKSKGFCDPQVIEKSFRGEVKVEMVSKV